MTEWVAVVCKLRSADGFWTIQPQSKVMVGTELRIDFDSREDRKFVNANSGKEFTAEVVTMLDKIPGNEHQFFPVELLDL